MLALLLNHILFCLEQCPWQACKLRLISEHWGKERKQNKILFTVNCFLVVCGSSLNIITNRCCGYRVLCVLQAHAGWILFDVGHMNQRFQFKSIPSEDMTMSSMAVVESNANTEENRPSTSFVTTLCR